MVLVLGYHGCDNPFAEGVRSGAISLDQWKPSQNQYDWLGVGIYFWEGSRTRAMEWAVERFGDQAEVLEAEVELGQCLNFLESTYHRALRATFLRLRGVYRSQGLLLPKNHRKRHDLDCLVIDTHVEFAAQQRFHFQTVRGVFEEGRPLFPGSAIRTQSHIQIAVRDPQCIRIQRKTGGTR